MLRDRRRPPGRPQGLPVLARRRERARARQRVRADPRAGVHPRDEAVRGGDPRRQVGATRRRRRAVPHPLRRHRHGRRGLHRARRPGRDASPRRSARASTPSIDSARRDPARRARCSPGRTSTLAADQLEVAMLDRTRVRPRVPPDQGRRARRDPRRLSPCQSRHYQRRSDAEQRADQRSPTSDRDRTPPAPTPSAIGAGVPPVGRRGERRRRPRRRAARSGRRRAGPRARTRRPGPCRPP